MAVETGPLRLEYSGPAYSLRHSVFWRKRGHSGEPVLERFVVRGFVVELPPTGWRNGYRVSVRELRLQIPDTLVWELYVESPANRIGGSFVRQREVNPPGRFRGVSSIPLEVSGGSLARLVRIGLGESLRKENRRAKRE